MMFTIDYKSRIPLYQQIMDNVERLAVLGLLAPGQQLPGIRSLAVELSINPNTIARAYAELETRGVIRSLPGRGSFISEDTEALRLAGRQHLRERAAAAAREARRLHLGKSEFLELCSKSWEESTVISEQGGIEE